MAEFRKEVAMKFTSLIFSLGLLGCLSPSVLLAQSGIRTTPEETISADDPRLIGFATEIVSYTPAAGLGAAVSDPSAALGAPNAGSTGSPDFTPLGLASLGDAAVGEAAGSIVVTFGQPIRNGVGGDFAVFENAFGTESIFAELAFVSVSSDGIFFSQFQTTSLTTLPDEDDSTPPLATDLDAGFGLEFANIPGRDFISGFAGAEPTNFGTVFDLENLISDPLVVSGDVDLTNIQFIRLEDVPGDGRFADSSGRPIFDAFSPGNATGGFDLDAIGIVSVPEPASSTLLCVFSAASVLVRRRRQ